MHSWHNYQDVQNLLAVKMGISPLAELSWGGRASRLITLSQLQQVLVLQLVLLGLAQRPAAPLDACLRNVLALDVLLCELVYPLGQPLLRTINCSKTMAFAARAQLASACEASRPAHLD